MTLLGEKIRLQRIGTNGDEVRARALYRDMDGKVDALGVGGIDLHVHMPWKSYPLHGALRLVQDVRRTPVVDGTSLRRVLERRVMQLVEHRIGKSIKTKKAFLVEAITRSGMLESFLEAGYECVFGDLMFALGIPIALHSLKAVSASPGSCCRSWDTCRSARCTPPASPRRWWCRSTRASTRRPR